MFKFTPQIIEAKEGSNRLYAPDGVYNGTIVDIQERENDKTSVVFCFYQFRWQLIPLNPDDGKSVHDEKIIRYVNDFITPESPLDIVREISLKRLATMSEALLGVKPGTREVDIMEFMNKSARVVVKNKPDKNDPTKSWAQIVNISPKAGYKIPASSQTREQVIKDYDFDAPQPSTSNYHAVVEDDIPF